MLRRVVLSKLNDGLKKERKKEKKNRGILVISFIKIKKKYDYSERWIIWLMGLWKMQLIARQRVNCRTHEHRHFERTLRSMDTISGSGLAEGRSRNPNTCIAYRYSSYIWSFFSLSFFIIPVVVFKIERFRVGCQKSRRGQVSKEEDARRTSDCWTFIGVCRGHDRNCRIEIHVLACGTRIVFTNNNETTKHITDLRPQYRESSISCNGWLPVFHRFELVFNVISYPPLLRFVCLWITKLHTTLLTSSKTNISAILWYIWNLISREKRREIPPSLDSAWHLPFVEIVKKRKRERERERKEEESQESEYSLRSFVCVILCRNCRWTVTSTCTQVLTWYVFVPDIKDSTI